MDKKPLEWVGAFESELGLPSAFFIRLLQKEDDWSFIIKLHALIEAALAHLLAIHSNEKLLNVFVRMGMRSKVAFAKALGVLDKDERIFISKLSGIRNSFAHDVHQAGATMAAYVAALDPEQLKSLKVAIGPGIDPVTIVEPPVPELDFVRDNPKLCIWLRALFVISFIYQRKDIVLLKRKVADENQKLLESLRELERLRRTP